LSFRDSYDTLLEKRLSGVAELKHKMLYGQSQIKDVKPLFMIPSIYWPIAKLGFSNRRNRRKIFRLVFSNFYRKRIWSILINSWAKQKGFDKGEYVVQNNVHSIGSGLFLLLILYWLHCSEYLQALGFVVAELLINMPAIVLSRYLYLITTRKS
jgi:hypothetical protein